MSEWTLRPAAARDLSEIWDYTFDTWGLDQAEIYLEAIRVSFGRAAEAPTIGRPVGRPGKRQLRVKSGSHVIIYVGKQDGIDIVRVLHEHMDLDRYL